MSDDLVKRLRGCTDGTVSGKLRHEAATAIIAKDAEIARLRILLNEARDELYFGWGTEQVTMDNYREMQDLTFKIAAALENRDG